MLPCRRDEQLELLPRAARCYPITDVTFRRQPRKCDDPNGAAVGDERFLNRRHMRSARVVVVRKDDDVGARQDCRVFIAPLAHAGAAGVCGSDEPHTLERMYVFFALANEDATAKR